MPQSEREGKAKPFFRAENIPFFVACLATAVCLFADLVVARKPDIAASKVPMLVFLAGWLWAARGDGGVRS